MDIRKIINRKYTQLLDFFMFTKKGDNWFFTYSGKKYKAPSKRQAKVYKQHLKKNFREICFPIKTEKSIVLDIGGNIGYTTQAYCKKLKGTNSMVYMFEPSLENLLCANYNLSMSNGYKIVPFALTNKDSESDKILKMAIPEWVHNLRKDTKNTGYLSAKGLNLNQTSSCEEVMSIKLDDLKFYNINNSSVKFIKIDVEGFELKVIEGAMLTIRKHLPIIQMEYNPFTLSNEELKIILELLGNMGYELYSETPLQKNTQNEIYFINPKKLENIQDDFLGSLYKN
jgi:FkbM family methyltransferase